MINRYDIACHAGDGTLAPSVLINETSCRLWMWESRFSAWSWSRTLKWNIFLHLDLLIPVSGVISSYIYRGGVIIFIVKGFSWFDTLSFVGNNWNHLVYRFLNEISVTIKQLIIVLYGRSDTPWTCGQNDY